MSEGTLEKGHSTFDARTRAVNAVVVEKMAVTDVARAFATNRSTIHRWVTRFRSEGEDGLVRRDSPGRPRLFSDLDGAALTRIVMSPATDYGYETAFWTTPRLIQVINEKFRVTVSKQTMMRRLHEAGMTYQKPERQYFELSEEERQTWRRSELPKIRRAVRENKAILYFQDEANISLTAILGKTWAPRGRTPKQRVTGKRGGVSAMSAITRGGELIFRLHDKRIASGEVIEFLGQMLRHHPRRHLVVVMDRAPPHTSKKTRAYIDTQRRLHVFHFPKYSPDWNPDEKLWSHLKYQELKAHQAKTQKELKLLANDKLTEMSMNPDLIEGIFFRCCMADVLSA